MNNHNKNTFKDASLLKNFSRERNHSIVCAKILPNLKKECQNMINNGIPQRIHAVFKVTYLLE